MLMMATLFIFSHFSPFFRSITIASDFRFHWHSGVFFFFFFIRGTFIFFGDQPIFELFLKDI